jgi:hypothetical protein
MDPVRLGRFKTSICALNGHGHFNARIFSSVRREYFELTGRSVEHLLGGGERM